MKYVGPLYGKIGRKTFDTGKTSHDWDRLEQENARLREGLQRIADWNGGLNAKWPMEMAADILSNNQITNPSPATEKNNEKE